MENLIKVLLISGIMSGSFITQAMEDFQPGYLRNAIAHYQEFADMSGLSLPDFLDQQIRILEQNSYSDEWEIENLKSIKISYLQTHKKTLAELRDDEVKTRHLLEGFDDFSQGGFVDTNEEASLRLARQLEALDMQDGTSTGNDYLLAIQLQETESKFGTYNIPFLKQQMSNPDKEIYQTIATASKGIKNDSDVHTMTATFARPYFNETKKLEQTYLGIVQQHKSLTLENITEVIQGVAQRNQAISALMPPINEALALIRGYWNTPIDGETGLDIREVMSNCFILARTYGDAALENLCIILADNKQTGGGCHPGVTGRFAHSYFIEVSAALAQAQ